MVTFDIIIREKEGLHANSAADISREAERYVSSVMIGHEDISLNARSLMGMLALKAGKGDTLHVVIEGPDEKLAAEGIRRLLDEELA